MMVRSSFRDTLCLQLTMSKMKCQECSHILQLKSRNPAKSRMSVSVYKGRLTEEGMVHFDLTFTVNGRLICFSTFVSKTDHSDITQTLAILNEPPYGSVDSPQGWSVRVIPGGVSLKSGCLTVDVDRQLMIDAFTLIQQKL